ncbi:MAG: helix-turn-helix transcriptional regulator [Clostridia bacterium]|nr:helix-turn-helix transcriptional regulator [Clostridia bacterium]
MKRSNFAKNLSVVLKYKGYTQKQLADLLSVNQGTICRWLKGTREPDLNTLLLLCEVLDESPNELLGFTSPAKKSV